MSKEWTVEDLEHWDERIFAFVRKFGLDPYDQEFEVCDYEGMLSYMVYSGMPSRYPHWSYGKAHEKLKTLYNYGISGLPYEMVINSNPSIAYLMRDNSLALQILTIAHVYPHSDFFKNNFTFRTIRSELTTAMFKSHATRVRKYIEDPSIGLEKVEKVLDAAHAVSLQCRRNLSIKKLKPEEAKDAKIEEAKPKYDPNANIHRRKKYIEPDTKKIPQIPDEDILLFIRDYQKDLDPWEKDLLTIVHEEAQYFIPQIETKIMNEGWASFWHKRILEALDLPQDLHMEFIVKHTQVLAPHPGGLNPYHVGLKVWEDIEKRWNKGRFGEEYENCPSWQRDEWDTKTMKGTEKIFQVREVERDPSFIRRYLTEELVRELNLFEYATRGDDRVVSRVADEDNWQAIKETLIKNVGIGTVPVIKVEDADYNQSRTLFLKHDHDGRDLQLEYAEKTLQYLAQLWGRQVVLETIINEKKTLLSFADGKLSFEDV